MKNKVIGSFIGMLVTALFGVAYVAHANPSFFAAGNPTGTATSSVSYINPGLGTTTLSVTFNVGSGNSYKIDQALVVFQATASTTDTQTVNARVQYSMDNIDWYSPTEATTTYNTVVEKAYVFNISTTSDQVLSRNGTSWRVQKSFMIDTPTPYVRVQFFVPAGKPQVALWTNYQPVKEQY